MNVINKNYLTNKLKIDLGTIESYQTYEINQTQHIVRLFSSGGLGLPVDKYHRSIFEISFFSAQKVDQFVTNNLHKNLKKINQLNEKPYANSHWTVRDAFNTPHIYRLDSTTTCLQIKVSPSKESPDNHMSTEFQNIEHRPLEFYQKLLEKFPRSSTEYSTIDTFIKNLNLILYQADLETLANMEKQILIPPEEKPEYIALRQCYGVAEPKSDEHSQRRLEEEITALKNSLKTQQINEEPTIKEDIIENSYEQNQPYNNKNSPLRNKASYNNLTRLSSKKS